METNFRWGQHKSDLVTGGWAELERPAVEDSRETMCDPPTNFTQMFFWTKFAAGEETTKDRYLLGGFLMKRLNV